MPTDSCSHSMLSFRIFSPSSSSSPQSLRSSSAGFSSHLSPPAGLLPPQVKMEALGEIFFDEFHVDDLLDLRGLPEPEKDVEEEEERGGASIDAEEKEAALFFSEISLPEETEAAHLEWLSRFVDDCHSEYPPPPCFAPVLTALSKNLAAGIQLPPSSSSEAGCRLNTAALIPVKAKRSKRPRSTGAPWSLSGPPRFGDASSDSSITSSPSSSSSSLTILLVGGNPASPKFQFPKKRGRRPKNYLSCTAGTGSEGRCRHCGVQRTPQWRAGPHGPKTLCNACGVRYKSGRLLPEYRPASSPTFLSDVHSNSHRKVLEMRRKKEAQLFTASAPPVPSF